MRRIYRLKEEQAIIKDKILLLFKLSKEIDKDNFKEIKNKKTIA